MTRQDSLDAVMPLPLGPEVVRAQRVLGGFLKRACGLPLRTDVNATLAAATKAEVQGATFTKEGGDRPGRGAVVKISLPKLDLDLTFGRGRKHAAPMGAFDWGPW